MQPETYVKETSAQAMTESKQTDASTATRELFDLLSLNNLAAFGSTR
jgi:hypothetical protein